jgi:branched-chain amino acid transport system substrate-binding protein
VGLATFFRQTFESLGGKIASEENYIAGDQDFKAQLTAIKGVAPDAVFIPGYYTEVGLIGRQTRELGITVPLLGGDGWDSPKTVEIARGALEGCYFSNHYTASDPRPAVQNFIQKYQTKYGEKPDAMAPLSYDAAGALIAAIRRAGGPDPMKIRDELANTVGYDGVCGTITIDENRNAVKSAVVVQIQGSDFIHVATIEP